MLYVIVLFKYFSALKGESVMRYLTAGESHGPQLTAIIEGLPAQLPLTAEMINKELKRRQGGHGRAQQQGAGRQGRACCRLPSHKPLYLRPGKSRWVWLS